MEKSYVDVTEKESSYGRIFKISGQVIVAEGLDGARMYELVKIGESGITGEIIKMDGDVVSIQCFEDMSKLSVGDPVLRLNKPLTTQLGPGILENLFDGMQRPLETTARSTDSVFMPAGVDISPLNEKRLWEFKPSPGLKVGSLMTGGDIIGTVVENSLFTEHRILLPPKARGRIIYIAPEGDYMIKEDIVELENDGKKSKYSMVQTWPARQPRPVAEKLACNTPLFTGLRVLDVLFPAALGGTCTLPGASGCGKSVITQAITKYSNNDVVVFTSCGERGNEVTKLMKELPELSMMVKGREENVMQRTCLVANTANMPLAGREASIYTGVTIAEYFRDMGYNVSMIADSTSRWIESLRDISGYLGEQLGNSGYPSYLSTKIAQFYDRAGRVQCLGSLDRQGTLTLIGTLSPPGGDFTDPVVCATLNVVQTFWGLDRKLVQRRHFPSINWEISFSNYNKQLEPHFKSIDSDFSEFKTKIQEILQEESEVLEMVNLIGRDELSDEKKLVLHVGRMIREDFLQQNVFSEYDYISSHHKTIGMMKCIVAFYDEAKLTIVTSKQSNKISWSLIYTKLKKIIFSIEKLKFEGPKVTKHEMKDITTKLIKQMNEAFLELIIETTYDQI